MANKLQPKNVIERFLVGVKVEPNANIPTLYDDDDTKTIYRLSNRHGLIFLENKFH